jgi:transcription antitermination factor NusA-like protein
MCESCSSALTQGKITRRDVEVSRVFQKLEDRGLVKGPSFHKTVEAGDLVLVLTRERVGPLVGKQGRVIRQVSQEIGRKVRVVNTRDARTALQDLVFPARLIGLNVVYAPEGEITKLVIPRGDAEKLVAPKETLEAAAKTLAGDKTVVIEFK